VTGPHAATLAWSALSRQPLLITVLWCHGSLLIHGLETEMTGPRAHVIDGMKFMWDGVNYDNAADAGKAKEVYEHDHFDARVVEEDGEYHVYTRRVVTEVVGEGSSDV
jgi:hypothetical protein